MTSIQKRTPWLWFLGFSLLFTLQVVPQILRNSPIDDEPIELTNGYFYWAGDVLTHNRHPPLSETFQALPLRFMGLNEKISPPQTDNQLRAYYFFFVSNKARFEAMLQGGRFMTLLLGFGIGLLLFFQVRAWHLPGCLTALALWAFHPTILAYSGLAMADIPITFFFLASVLAFQKHLETPGARWAALSGALAGAAACSKFSALALVPLFLLLETVPLLQKEKRRVFDGASQGRDWLWGTAGFLSVIFLVYLPGTLFQPGHRLPWFYFLAGLRNLMAYSGYHHPNYFLGHATRENHWLYFPVVFLLKNTLPFLLFLLLAILEAFRKKGGYPLWMWLSPLFFFLCILPVQNLGVRYLLPVVPFVILMASRAVVSWWQDKNRLGKGVIVGLLLWNTASVLASAPDMISYFNDLVPSERKIRYLADCDLDMGQDVKRLAQTAVLKGWKNVKLAQFGGAVDPSLYGLDWKPWTQKDLSGPQPGWVYAVNVGMFQTGPAFWPDLLPIAQGWAAGTTPTGRVGDTWIYFEIPGSPPPDPSPALSSVRIF